MMMKILAFILFLCILISKGISQITDCQKNIWHICYEDSSYPMREIEETWNNLNSDTQMTFGKVLDQNPETESISEPCALCETAISMKVQPVSLLEPNQKTYILSTDKYPRPQINIKVCKDGATCNIDRLQNDFQTKCVQRKAKINVLSYNVTSKEFEGVALIYPSDCECLVQVEE